MRSYNCDEPLISIHIPKTGGTSFQYVIKKWFGDKCIFNYRNRDGSLPLKHELKKGYCLHGHFNRKRNFAIENNYSNVKQFITIMRNPIALHESLYQYKFIKKRSKNENRDKRVPRSIDEFFEEHEPTTLYHLPKELNIENYKKLLNESFIHIGLLESIDNSIRIMAEKLNKEFIPIPHKNRTVSIERPSTQALNAFIDRNPLLFKLYEFAEKIN